MDFFLSKDGLERATPEETKITNLTAKPRSDGRRVLVNMQITPFQKRPSLQVNLQNANGEEVASTNILETMGFKLEFTMHIRGEIQNPYTLIAKLYYLDGPSAEPFTISFDVYPSSEPDKENFPE
ncbi:MAG: hypothetical protein KF758_01045 [Anaerolineales bacterium]|nr:hypothetical protein [Anaerolineales bacterium]MBX3035471.1 hypothetical protein [Anaerolineales bacterium]